MNHAFVVLCYKFSPFLEDCIESLLNQNLKSQIELSTSTNNYELIQLGQKYNLKIHDYSGKGSGIAYDWNNAFHSGDTDWVTLVHQDDLYHPEYIEKLSQIPDNIKENTLIFYTNYLEIDTNGKPRAANLNLKIKNIMNIIFTFPFGIVNSTFRKKLLLSLGSPIPCPSVTYHKKILKNFRFNSELKINLDWDAWISMSKLNGNFVYIKQKLIQHRIHSESETSKGIEENIRYNEDYYCFSKMWPKIVARALLFFYKYSYKSNYN
jgi:hypothetical protein